MAIIPIYVPDEQIQEIYDAISHMTGYQPGNSQKTAQEHSIEILQSVIQNYHRQYKTVKLTEEKVNQINQAYQEAANNITPVTIADANSPIYHYYFISTKDQVTNAQALASTIGATITFTENLSDNNSTITHAIAELDVSETLRLKLLTLEETMAINPGLPTLYYVRTNLIDASLLSTNIDNYSITPVTKQSILDQLNLTEI